MPSLYCSRLREKIVDFVLGKFELQRAGYIVSSRGREELISSVWWACNPSTPPMWSNWERFLCSWSSHTEIKKQHASGNSSTTVLPLFLNKCRCWCACHKFDSIYSKYVQHLSLQIILLKNYIQISFQWY